MKSWRIDHPHNEASALLGIHDYRLLDSRDWSEGFWIANDEKPAHKAIAALGRRKGGEGDDCWEVLPLDGTRSDLSRGKKTEDAEAFARAGSWLYLFGSQFGSKDGPLEPTRHFVARLNEAMIDLDDGKWSVEMDVVREPFLLHRLINDALQRHCISLLPRGEREQNDFMAATRKMVGKSDKEWCDRIRPEDHPINIEGAAFLESGILLLGLRMPVSADGHPLVVEIEGIDRYFAKKADPPMVRRILLLSTVGSARQPHGIREIDVHRDSIHFITGDLDSSPDRSAILKDHPEGKRAVSTHWMSPLPLPDSAELSPRRVRQFNDDAAVEGITISADGAVWYAHDDEQIRLDRA